MDAIAVGFWGAYFGTAALALGGAFVFMRSAKRVALTGALTVLLSTVYALVFLGWVPVEQDESLKRLQAVVAIASSAVLALLLLALLRTFRKPSSVLRVRAAVAGIAFFGFAASFLFPPYEALEFSVLLAISVASAAVIASFASARRGERAGWLMLGALPCAVVGVVCLDWYAIHPGESGWKLHAASALAGMGYLVCIAAAMWSRYSYLIEVRKVMEHGPNFDPVTWMPAIEAGQPVHDGGDRPVGLLVVSLSNLHMLEQLHGRAAYNHALFACASRLRKLGLPAELSRLREDAFVFVFRASVGPDQLIEYSRLAQRRLARPVLLGTNRSDPEGSAALWEPNTGVGVFVEHGDTPLEIAIAGARAMSRTAWSFPSRMAWYDEAGQEISELPAV